MWEKVNVKGELLKSLQWTSFCWIWEFCLPYGNNFFNRMMFIFGHLSYLSVCMVKITCFILIGQQERGPSQWPNELAGWECIGWPCRGNPRHHWVFWNLNIDELFNNKKYWKRKRKKWWLKELRWLKRIEPRWLVFARTQLNNHKRI